MASALLASSRNDSYWGEQQVYMRKTPNLTPNTGLLRPNSNPKFANNPNHNPNFVLTASNQPNHSCHAIEPDAAAVSDDSSCFHRRDSGGGEYVSFNISALSRKELRELKRRLVSELDQVRSVTSRIEARSREIHTATTSARSGIYCGGGRDVSSSTAAVVPFRSDGGGKQRQAQPPEKEKKARTPVGTATTDPKKKEQQLSPAASMEMVKPCRQILTKMLKMKGCQWFKSPVDAVGMGLHDYHKVVKHPMDLGTVRSRLNKGLYPSPLDFASDVRLTFSNALLYNPQGHEVHRVAALLLNYFESQFGPMYHNIQQQQQQQQPPSPMDHHHHPSPPMSRAIKPPAPTIPPPSPLQKQQQPVSVSRPAPTRQKLPNPKAKEEKKRAMTMQEKFELTESLQRLPQEKMDHVLQIMKRRHVVAAQDGDEIELDFEVMDNETLWELDRFVASFSNTLEEEKEQVQEKGACYTSPPPPPAPAPAHHHPQGGGGGNGKSPMAAAVASSGETVGSKKSRPACEDDDVDIIGDGDEMPSTNYPYPSLEIQKDAAGGGNSSCTSATDSSSSSGSDSGTSSGSDSDSDDDNDALG